MNLGIFNNLFNNIKKNNKTEELINELENNLNEKNGLREENILYQVVEVGKNSAYLQNTKSNQISEEKNIPQEILGNIEEDTILRYKDGNYIVEEEMTQRFFDSLVGAKEYQEIQQNFIKQSNILENKPDTKYKIQKQGEKYSILMYEKNNQTHIIKAPNELIPFFIYSETILYFKDGKFKRST